MTQVGQRSRERAALTCDSRESPGPGIRCRRHLHEVHLQAGGPCVDRQLVNGGLGGLLGRTRGGRTSDRNDHPAHHEPVPESTSPHEARLRGSRSTTVDALRDYAEFWACVLDKVLPDRERLEVPTEALQRLTEHYQRDSGAE